MIRKHGRARVSLSDPQAFAQCDRCGFVYNLPDLKHQMMYAGTGLVRTGWKVCDPCLDIPNPQLKARFLRPDPVPVKDPRPLDRSQPGPDLLVTEALMVPISTEDGDDIVKENGA